MRNYDFEKRVNVIDWGWWCGVNWLTVWWVGGFKGAGSVRGVMEVGESSGLLWLTVWSSYQVERIRAWRDESKERRQTWKKVDQVGPHKSVQLITEVPLKLVFCCLKSASRWFQKTLFKHRFLNNIFQTTPNRNGPPNTFFKFCCIKSALRWFQKTLFKYGFLNNIFKQPRTEMVHQTCFLNFGL